MPTAILIALDPLKLLKIAASSAGTSFYQLSRRENALSAARHETGSQAAVKYTRSHLLGIRTPRYTDPDLDGLRKEFVGCGGPYEDPRERCLGGRRRGRCGRPG